MDPPAIEYRKVARLEMAERRDRERQAEISGASGSGPYLGGKGIDNMPFYEQALKDYQKGVQRQGAAWYLSCYIASDDRDDDDLEDPQGHWLLRGNQRLWHVSTIHVDHYHARERNHDCRYTVADYISLGLRDGVDIFTGDWNQAG